MLRNTPDITDSFIYHGVTYSVEWFDLDFDQPVPSLNWQQVYAVGDLSGDVPLVCYDSEEVPYNLPGGKFEPGETVDQTVRRELEEELNMRTIMWQPIGYQKVISPDGNVSLQLRVYAKLEKIGEFTNDPGGSVIGNKVVPLAELNDYIHYGSIGERMIELVREVSIQK